MVKPVGRLRIFLSSCVLAVCVGWQPTCVFAQDTKPSPAHPIGNLGDWFPQSSMPAESVVRGQVGAVVIQLSLNSDGTVKACRVVESSGYPLLDAGACERAKSVGRFEPAHDGKGNRVASTFTLPQLRYVLSKENLSAVTVDANRKVYNSTIQIDVDKSGTIEACRSLNTDMPDKSACADYVVGKPAPSVFKVSSGSKVTISNTIVIDRNGER